MSNLSKWKVLLIIAVILVCLLVVALMFQKPDMNVIHSKEANSSNISVEYTSDELLGEYTNYTAKFDLNSMSIVEGTGITISGTTLNISNAGIYYFSGTADETNIVVNADNQEVVLVLDNVSIACSSTSIINVVDAKKVTVNVPTGTTSTLTDSSKYTIFTEDDEPNATIFSKDDLSIDGKGTLIINANYEDAIASKDGLKIIGTTLNINSADDAIRGKDYVAIKDANINILSKGKGIKATEDTDTSLGFILIDSGTFKIESDDDALHSSNKIVINDGEIEINAGDDGIHADSNIAKSYEGIEANYIEINGGDISVVASDDGININGGNDSFGMMRQDAFKTIAEDDNDNRVLIINGGNITVEANGDGLDSNGSIKITGGNILVGGSTNGGNGALDYNYSLVISGGTLIAYGPTGMWQNPSSNSTQYTIAFATTGKAGDKVELKDLNGYVIESFTAKRSYGMVCISTEKLKEGEIYELYINDEGIGSQELISIVTSNGTSQEGFMGGGRMPFQMNSGDRSDFQMESGDKMPQLPEGMSMEDIQNFTDGERPEPPANGGETPDKMPNGERPQRPNDGNIEMSRSKRIKKETSQSDNNISNTDN